MGNPKKTPAHNAGSKPAAQAVRAKGDAVGSKAGVAAKTVVTAKTAPKPTTKAAAGTNAKAGSKAASGLKSMVPKSTAGAVGGIDTSGAAAAAARFLVAGLGKSTKPGGAAPAPQSALFKQIKSGANHPVEKQLGGFLDRTTPAGTKRLDQDHGRGGPQGHNQTIGGDASRINVPRRTGG
jgi:hypothetical protein